MEILFYIILIVACGLMSRMQGGGLSFGDREFKHIELPFMDDDDAILFDVSAYGFLRKFVTFFYGFTLGFVVSDDWRVWFATSICWWLGEKPSWRKLFNEVSGVTIEEDFLFSRCMFRGALWAVPSVVFLAWFDANILFLFSMSLAFPVSMYWGYRKQAYFDKHAFTELSRGALMGAALILLME